MTTITDIYYTNSKDHTRFLVKIEYEDLTDNETEPNSHVVTVYKIDKNFNNDIDAQKTDIKISDKFDPNFDVTKFLSEIDQATSMQEKIQSIQTNLIAKFEASEVFVGNIKKGISVLAKLRGSKEYVYIGDCIFSFTPEEEIISYCSNEETFNSYAVDLDNRCYLLNEHVILATKNTDFDHWHFLDPYKYYSDINLITPDETFIKAKEPVYKNFEGISKFLINNKVHTLRYMSNPDQEYDYIIEEFKCEGRKALVAFKDEYGISYSVTKEEFVTIIEEFGKLISCKNFQVKKYPQC